MNTGVIMNLYQRINEVRKSIDYIQKDKSVSTGNGSYKAVTHDQVTGMVREHMVKHGIVSYPVLVESMSQPKEVNAAMETAKQFRYEATYDFHFVNIDDSKDELIIRIQAHAMDNADKAPGKALSYAKKYAVLKLFEIETGEDDESRYQEKEEFNIATWGQLIEDSQDLSILEKNYLEAKTICLKNGDSSSMKALNALTIKRKTELEKV
jgi:hypothetical protein